MRTRMSGGVAGDVGLNARRPYADSLRYASHPIPGVRTRATRATHPRRFAVPLSGPQPHQRPSHRARLETFAKSA
jgi:hypothetical protein